MYDCSEAEWIMEETDLLGWVRLNDSDNRRSSDWYLSFLWRPEACPLGGMEDVCRVVDAMYDQMSCEV